MSQLRERTGRGAAVSSKGGTDDKQQQPDSACAVRRLDETQQSGQGGCPPGGRKFGGRTCAQA